MTRSEIMFGLLRLPFDALAALAAMLIAYRLRQENIDLFPAFQFLAPLASLPDPSTYVRLFALPWTIVVIAVHAALRSYALRVTAGPWKELWRAALGAVLWMTLVMTWFFLVQRQLFFSRALLLHTTVFLAIFSMMGRSTVLLLQRACLRAGIGVRRLVSYGLLPLPSTLRDVIACDPRYRYIGHLRTIDGIERLHSDEAIDLLLHTDAAPASDATRHVSDYCRNRHIAYAFLPPVFADVPHQLSIGAIGLLPMLRFEPTPLDGWGRVWKRCIDLLMSIILSIVLLPVLLVIALMVLLCDGWPIVYQSMRVGQYGTSLIPVWKFRTMTRDADKKKSFLSKQNVRQDGPLFKVKDDPRVTRLGRMLRRFSIDELPQIFNVLSGHLSLVGPRPHLPEEVARYHDDHRRVLVVRPGITGLSQISGRSGLRFEDEIRHDMRYIEEWSPLLDLWILWRTIWVVCWGKDAD